VKVVFDYINNKFVTLGLIWIALSFIVKPILTVSGLVLVIPFFQAVLIFTGIVLLIPYCYTVWKNW
jgi:hypothetical protein